MLKNNKNKAASKRVRTITEKRVTSTGERQLSKAEREDAPKMIVQLSKDLWCEILAAPCLVDNLLDISQGLLTLGFSEDSIHELTELLQSVKKKKIKTAPKKKTQTQIETQYVGKCAERMHEIDRDGELASLVRQMTSRMVSKSIGKKNQHTKFLGRVEQAAKNLDNVRHKFLQSNQGLVAEIAKRYRNRGLPLTDLMQEGNLGLISALNRFDYEKGFKFSTYACWWIQSAVGRAVESKVATVRIPVSAKKQANLLQKTRHAFQARNGRFATDEEIAKETGWDRARLEKARAHSSTSVVSLDQTISAFEGLKYSDVLADEETLSPFDNVVLRSWTEDLNDLLETLTPEERTILNWRFGLTDFCELTLEEIGKRFGLSRERIRQIQEGALSKLREKLQLDAA
jgi:RNA polymerase sigma factor (sigma-70 family)